ncbi:hypothetical protein BDV96DRAFT_652575 [Lophiotrema nucula]|uniref:F-box domain-containing protein n=1 Tax=Lophiotrema nucula TaxID=690887 RepID=A0A6A5YPK2_9PLEO|nr:hypothetical protein BDV96DRAFT_652575 [Lophiotrema nucula]
MPETRSKGILDLPDELLCTVIEYLLSPSLAEYADDSRTNPGFYNRRYRTRALCRLSRACRRLNWVTRDYLYSSFYLTRRYEDDDEAIHLLVRTLIERPELHLLFKKATIDSSLVGVTVRKAPIKRSPQAVDQLLDAPEFKNIPRLERFRHGIMDGYLDAATAHLLLLLPNLEDLQIVQHNSLLDKIPRDYYSVNVLDMAGTLGLTSRFHGFPALRTLQLCFTPQDPAYMSGACLLIPSLRKVRLANVVLWSPFEHDWKCPPYSSPVTELELIGFKWDCLRHFGKLFRSFKNLNSVFLDGGDANWNRATIFQALKNQKHALETLTYCHNAMYDGFMPSLQDFKRLRNLAIADSSIFDNWLQSPTQAPTQQEDAASAYFEQLSSTFPPSLEILTHLIPWTPYEEEDDGESLFHAWRIKYCRAWEAVPAGLPFHKLQRVCMVASGFWESSVEYAVLWPQEEVAEGVFNGRVTDLSQLFDPRLSSPDSSWLHSYDTKAFG